MSIVFENLTYENKQLTTKNFSIMFSLNLIVGLSITLIFRMIDSINESLNKQNFLQSIGIKSDDIICDFFQITCLILRLQEQHARAYNMSRATVYNNNIESLNRFVWI